MSAQSPESIANLALTKLGADPIASLSAPTKPNEKLMALLYAHHRDTELRKHRWLFALEVVKLTPTGEPIENDIDGLLYRFQFPTNALRAVRIRGCTWQVRGRQILDVGTTTTVKFVLQVDPVMFDSLFAEAVACQMAMQACEKITRSTDKLESLKDEYNKALDAAKRANAVELGPEIIEATDDKFEWMAARNY